jgi:hypothetical protein
MPTSIGGIKIPELTYPVLTSSSIFYIDTGFLEDYVEIMGLDSTFPAAGVSDAEKQSAVYRAQVYIESLVFQGGKTEPYNQILQFPRYAIYDNDGVLIDSDQTPYDIFNAVAEGAYLEYNSIGVLQPQIVPTNLAPISNEEVSAGSVSTKTSYDTSKMSQEVSHKLGGDLYTRLVNYLENWLGVTGTTFMKVART